MAIECTFGARNGWYCRAASWVLIADGDRTFACSHCRSFFEKHTTGDWISYRAYEKLASDARSKRDLVAKVRAYLAAKKGKVTR